MHTHYTHTYKITCIPKYIEIRTGRYGGGQARSDNEISEHNLFRIREKGSCPVYRYYTW
ncbi:hypothetical protein WN55_06039 [Dufourea novaeangliae]|uniref:Uncharacterized protein n=1 Tax=Dufourea novaeangliae TaxID=178035 RepID=A0A154PRL3_DUFNO|nr:hypothetical protein WN55_06039 [Dufourea novaeangliae]